MRVSRDLRREAPAVDTHSSRQCRDDRDRELRELDGRLVRLQPSDPAASAKAGANALDLECQRLQRCECVLELLLVAPASRLGIGAKCKTPPQRVRCDSAGCEMRPPNAKSC